MFFSYKYNIRKIAISNFVLSSHEFLPTFLSFVKYGVRSCEISMNAVGEKVASIVSVGVSVIVWQCWLIMPCWTTTEAQERLLPDADKLEIRFLDVGEGDAAVIWLPGQVLPVIVDVGNLVTGAKVYKALIDSGRGLTVGHLFITHPHLDHTGGAFTLLGLLTVDNLYDNGQVFTWEAMESDPYRWYQEVVRSHRSYRCLAEGDVIDVDGLRLEVLHPPRGGCGRSSDKRGVLQVHDNWNNNSLVMQLSWGKFRALLMGDALVAVEYHLSVKFGTGLRSHVLKAGHHGSVHTGDPSFVAAVQPEVVVVSVNAENSRNYPDKNVLKRYARNKSNVYRTDRCGDITISAFKTGVYTYRVERGGSQNCAEFAQPRNGSIDD